MRRSPRGPSNSQKKLPCQVDRLAADHCNGLRRLHQACLEVRVSVAVL
jgi:hypothetical protein